MEKSYVKLVLTQEVVEKICADCPEFKVELEQMALKWVKKSVIKPLADKGTEHVREYAAENVQQLMSAVFNGKVFEDVKSSRYFLKEHKQLVEEARKAILEQIIPTPTTAREFQEEIKVRKETLLAEYADKVAAYLSTSSIEEMIHRKVNERISDIVAKLAKG